MSLVLHAAAREEKRVVLVKDPAKKVREEFGKLVPDAGVRAVCTAMVVSLAAGMYVRRAEHNQRVQAIVQ